jgi:serine/threonine-protein kinase
VIGRRFAVKLLHPHRAQQPSVLARFQREARAAGSLESEHIAAAIDFGEAGDGAPYLVMEHLAGLDLAALIERDGPLPAGRAAALVVQACRGLAAAHARGIVHRDLKPANLFLTSRSDGADLVKVLDFGIAKLLDTSDGGSSITATGKLLGTASYMAPEQARGDADIDHRVDVYALGAILYELLTSARAHPGAGYNATLFHILTQRCVPLRVLRPDLPRGLDDVVERAMAPRRDDRFATVAALAAALAPFAVTVGGAPHAAPGREARAAVARAARAAAETVEVEPTGGGTTPGADAGDAPAPARRRAARMIPIGLAATGLALAAAAFLAHGRRAAAPVRAATAAPLLPAPVRSAPAAAVPAPAPVVAPAEPPRPVLVSAPVKPPPAPPPPRRRPTRRREASARWTGGFDARNPYDE